MPALCLTLFALVAPSATGGPNDWDRVKSLAPGVELRVSLERARVLKGRLVEATDDALTLRVRDALQTLPSTQVIRIYRLDRDSMTNGILLGLAIGSGVGTAWGALAGAGHDIRAAYAVPWGLLIGAAAGTAIGAAADNAGSTSS